MGRNALRKLWKWLNFYEGQFYDAEYDMWFISKTHPLSPDYEGKEKA